MSRQDELSDALSAIHEDHVEKLRGTWQASDERREERHKGYVEELDSIHDKYIRVLHLSMPFVFGLGLLVGRGLSA